MSEERNNLHTMANELTRKLKENTDGTTQKQQVEQLAKLEESFRKSILKTRQGAEGYKKFITLIVAEYKNVLMAKPYFRERADSFYHNVSPAIKSGRYRDLMKYHGNYLLYKFIVDKWIGPMPDKSKKLFEKLVEVRKRLIENNTPLAINRAKIFYRKVPENGLDLTDMIGLACTGLISGVDKWHGPYSPVWRSTCIAYATNQLIENYSKTPVHLHPRDKAMLYRANQVRNRHRIEDPKMIAHILRKDMPEHASLLTADYVAAILATTSVASADAPIESESDNKQVSLKDYFVDDKESAEDQTIEDEAIGQVVRHAKMLPIINQKVLKLKGVKL